MASSDALEERVLPREAALRDAPVLRDAALRGRAELVVDVPLPFAAPPVVLSLSAMGFLLFAVETAGKPHGFRPKSCKG